MEDQGTPVQNSAAPQADDTATLSAPTPSLPPLAPQADLNAELQAMAEVGTALQGLDDAARQRVMDWAIARFAVSTKAGKGEVTRNLEDRGSRSEENAGVETPQFADLAAFFDKASPADGPERALVVGYWFQIVQQQENFTAQQVNDELKQLGHAITNITNAFTSLSEKKPALVRQVEKAGKSFQARKKYRVTDQGMKRVRAMLSREGSVE